MKIFEIFVFLMLAQNRVSPWGGGSNGPQMLQKFFCELFMIFVHKKKNPHPKLEKSDFLEHPIGQKRKLFFSSTISDLIGDNGPYPAITDPSRRLRTPTSISYPNNDFGPLVCKMFTVQPIIDPSNDFVPPGNDFGMIAMNVIIAIVS